MINRSGKAHVWAAHQLARRAAKNLVLTLAGEEIPTLLVKGIILASDLYSDVSERPICDVDVLVRPQDFPRVIWVAREQGWPRVWDSKTPGVVNLYVDRVPCDVAAFVGPAGTSALGVSDFLARATPQIGDLGFSHLHIDRHDHALLMAIDAFKDKLSNLKPNSCEDLVRFAKTSDFDPATLIARARAARLETMLWMVAAWVVEQRVDASWNEIRQILEAKPVRRRYADRYRRAAFNIKEGYSWRASVAARMVSDAPLRRIASVLLGIAGVGAYLATGRRLR